MADDWWIKPFSFESEGKPWAVLTDKVCLIGMQQESTLPELEGAESCDMQQIQRMLSAQPKNPPQITEVRRLKDFLTQDDFATILGVSVNSVRLTKILAKLREPQVGLWDASGPHFVHKTLGLVTPTGRFKAYLMGIRHTWTDLPVYEPEPQVEPEPEFDVFTALGEA